MRRNTDGPFTNWSAEITEKDNTHFIALFPMHGARTWAVEQCLEKFLALLDTSPELVQWARTEIENAQYLHDTPKGRISFATRINTSLYKRFTQYFPNRGGATWFIRRALSSMIVEAERRNFTMDGIVDASMQVFVRGSFE